MIKTLYKPFQHWSERGSVWIISDPHYGEETQPVYNEINSAERVQIVNKFVTKNDTLVILGDIGDKSYLSQLKTNNIVLILGNHDRGASYYDDCCSEYYTGPLTIAEKLILSHEPIDLPYMFNIHGHCHGCKSKAPNHLNLAGDQTRFEPVNLAALIKSGILTKIDSIHREAIDRQTANTTIPTALDLDSKLLMWEPTLQFWDSNKYRMNVAIDLFNEHILWEIEEKKTGAAYVFSQSNEARDFFINLIREEKSQSK